LNSLRSVEDGIFHLLIKYGLLLLNLEEILLEPALIFEIIGELRDDFKGEGSLSLTRRVNISEGLKFGLLTENGYKVFCSIEVTYLT
jgi:hypothetical protein